MESLEDARLRVASSKTDFDSFRKLISEYHQYLKVDLSFQVLYICHVSYCLL